jgi:radical SAM superfamily enzyme YgiQ (UPF0313 family)
MKVALMAPAGAMHRYNGSFSKSLHYAPLTLTTLAAMVPELISAEIIIHDETADYLPLKPEVDLIAMTVITGTSFRAYAWADYYRSLGIPVVLGGIHPTLLPEEAKLHADAVVTGFAEKSWPQLLLDFSNGQMQEFYRSDNNFSLENRPLPQRELLNKNRYITLNTVEVVRGCRHDCNFCVIPSVFGRQAWLRPVKEVIHEIEELPGKLVLFPDVNLITNPQYAKEFFRELIPLKKKWFGLVTTNIGENDELFGLMVKSGCKGLLIGFESVNENSISSVNKPFNRTREYETLVKKLHENGIGINGTFVFGSDGDDLSVFEKTVEFAQKLRIDLPRYALFTPFPGTELFNQLDQSGRIIEKNWAMYDVEHCVIKPAQMSPEQLEQGLAWAWNETYKTKSVFERILSPDLLFLFNLPLNLGYKMYAKKLSRFTKEIMTDNSDIPN